MCNDILGASEETEASDEESIEKSEGLNTPEVSSVKGFTRAFKEIVGFL